MNRKLSITIDCVALLFSKALVDLVESIFIYIYSRPFWRLNQEKKEKKKSRFFFLPRSLSSPALRGLINRPIVY